MKSFLNLGAACMLLVLAASCERDELSENQLADEFGIKSEISSGRLVSVYKYNQQGDIAEWESLYYYNRYLYDDAGRLTRRESAMDPAILSSGFAEKTTLMTSQNATINSYQTFDYDLDGKLAEVRAYFEKDGDFGLRSMRTFEHEDDYIIRENLHDEEGKITQFRTYEYDSRGNVKREMYYSLVLTEEPELINEFGFSYDDKRNPFTIFKALGNPGLYTNVNNVLESNTSYVYNQDDYPVKVVSENSAVDYTF